MYQLKRILIGLDFSGMDVQLLKYASVVADKIYPEVVYLFAVGKKLKLPKSLKEKYSGENTPIDEILLKELELRAKEYFITPPGCQVRFELRVGEAHKQIREWSQIKEIDLIMVGRRVSPGGNGKLASSITRASHCSVLIVPENPPGTLEGLLIPINVDNEENLPIMAVLELVKKSQLNITVQSIYDVPTGYHYSGKSFREFAKIMEQNARNKMELVKKRYHLEDYPVSYIFSLDDDHNLAEKIYETALKENVDMILMGSKGRTKTASLVLSSIAEKVTEYDKIVPLLIVKNKQKNLGFLDALKLI